MGIFQNGKLYNTLNVKYLLMRIYKRFFCVSILPLKINLQCSLLSSSQTMVIITQQLFNMALFGCAGSSCHAGFPLVMLGRSCGARASLLLYGLQPSGSWALQHGLKSCGAQAEPPRGTRDRLGPGVTPVSLALAGRFFITEPPGKPLCNSF